MKQPVINNVGYNAVKDFVVGNIKDVFIVGSLCADLCDIAESNWVDGDGVLDVELPAVNTVSGKCERLVLRLDSEFVDMIDTEE